MQVDGLTKSFGDLVLFRKISFGVAEGQRIGLIAKNGTGKTTLLNIIAGKEGYDEGSIVFRRDLRVGYLEQDPHYPEDLTVLEAFSTCSTVSALLLSSVPMCPLAFSSPLFWCRIVWMWIFLSPVHVISREIILVDSPELLMSYTMSRIPSMITSPTFSVR